MVSVLAVPNTLYPATQVRVLASKVFLALAGATELTPRGVNPSHVAAFN